ncbi:MAG: DNA repair protein RecN [Oscillospiraceae bacterium]|nr:DNA repair protein RecN [Oscillospiraceae bacterium]
MLTQLYIENIAVIEQVSIDFDSGLNVLTGETGAGKSMIIDAIHAILGERMSRDIVRSGAKSAFVSAVFDQLNPAATKALEEMGYVLEEDGTLLLQRTISADGKSACKINGRPATVSMLKSIAPHLIQIHGQHESYLLLSPNLHMEYIDKVGRLEPLLTQYQASYHTMRDIRAKRKALQVNATEKESRMEYLRYRINELEQADVQIGEWEDLTARKTRYSHSERIAQAVNSVREMLSGGDDGDGMTSMAMAAGDTLEEVQSYYDALSPLAERLRSITYDLEDIQDTLRDLSEEIEYDPAELERVEQRLDLLYRLSHKYGDTEEAMLQTLEQMETELHEMETAEETMQDLDAAYAQAKAKAIELARVLSERRSAVAETFAEQVRQQLCFLNMPGIRFSVSQERVPLNQMGCDQMEFLIAANPGEEPKPIAKIASGGELSRIMLAIKTVLSDGDEVDTLIFDEVDTGISGATAEKVGRKLQEVSRNRQVLCVTHLAQIAALGSTHFRIEKQVVDGRTYTHVQKLDFDGRCQEVARIMGGSEITELLLQNAGELLKSGGADQPR